MRGWKLAVVALLLAGCGTSSTSSTSTTTTLAPRPTLARGFHLSSPAFHSGQAIPHRYSCDGAGLPIPLQWSGVPKQAKELVLQMRDPDAPGSPFLHWVLAGISPNTHTLPRTPIEGRNSAGQLGYAAPCPPRGAKTHHYVITLTALSGPSGLRRGFSPDQLRTSALGIATLIGLYKRV